jgi:hypothetical protein
VDVVEGALVDGPFLAVDVAKVLGEFVALEAEFAAQEPAMGKHFSGESEVRDTDLRVVTKHVLGEVGPVHVLCGI